MSERMRQVAAEEGYERAHFQEGDDGEHFFGLQIFVKMSNRKLCEEDGHYVRCAANDIKLKLDFISAEMDPKAADMRKWHRQEIERIYAAAGVGAIFMEEISNGYCSQPCCLNRPWFRVTSRIGHVVIGWRKRVFHIDWKDSILKKRNGEELFPAEDVTRWATGIHAWDEKDAAKYIMILHGVA